MTEASSQLKTLHGNREEYSGVFVRINEGWNSYLNIPELKVVLDSIRGPNAEVLGSKQSFHFGKRFRTLGRLFPGDILQFDARISLSKKGVLQLINPTKVKRADGWVQTTL